MLMGIDLVVYWITMEVKWNCQMKASDLVGLVGVGGIM
jgi:hypothetical protein